MSLGGTITRAMLELLHPNYTKGLPDVEIHMSKNGVHDHTFNAAGVEPGSLVGRWVATYNGGYSRLEVTRGIGENRVTDTYEIYAQ